MSYIQTGEVQTHYEYYESAGISAKTIVFIHGIGLNSTYFYNLIPFLRQNFSVLLYDLRGHGESENSSGSDTLELLCDDLFILVHTLGLEDMVIVGHSFGANIAVHFAHMHERLVDCLVLISPQIFLPLPSLINEKELREEMAKEQTLEMLGQFMIQRLTVKHNEEHISKRIIQSYARLPVAMYLNHSDIALQFKIEKLRQNYKPTLVLSGELDPLFPPAFTSFYNAFIPNSTFLIVPDSSNMIFVDQPVYTGEWISQFILKPKNVNSDMRLFTKALLEQLIIEGYNQLFGKNKITIQCIGGFEIRMNGRTIREGWNTRYAKNLLIYLAFHKTATREELCDALFPDMDAKKALSNLRVYLNHFAKLLEPLPDEPPCLTIDRDSVFFNYAVGCDLEDVLEEMKRGLEEKDPLQKYAICKLLLQRAAHHILPGCFDTFSLSLREKFVQGWEHLALWAADYCCGMGYYEEAVQFITSCLHYYPNDEGLIERMVTIQILTNNKKELRKWTRKKKSITPP
ncbi:MULTISPECIES: alpha/beta hydrolase [unclassified Paenibacillus]|uniref:alpha/beta fold hydrolase n=1 Tax=unclassified Paenibacillus TaxID=185978 RepID=UPI001AE2FB18|nr:MULTISPECIES: alpha/beta hydrolase [unclassified Paenibacillus]MBP1154429.1 pimeloyl-ACP methyl ester carboxylesterase/DNA-binding SARP family transcriptional activator [Paenibacillus sp. PvP091]MBP1170187.1 pimeloyl-ACP methyl ester carboxylesterase/DNA-binding SARP family transcriptional activator [Paenibacillus sp. PvR098]MBP2441215.1 pimeloyl-ACP methyl ester carboxylesterase/two-component SAPR family response regulator [Paenibacillus sp. PvP052]